MIDFHKISSKFNSQKCFTSVNDFLQLECPIGSAVKVSSPQGTFMCKVFPRSHLPNNSLVFEDAVQIYSKIHGKLITNPLKSIHSIEKMSSPPAAHLLITIVADSLQDVNLLKQCRTVSLVKSLLSGKVFTRLSSVAINQAGIVSILVLESSHPESCTLNGRTSIKIASIVTSNWFQIQQRNTSQQLGGVAATYRNLEESLIFPLQNPKIFSNLRAPKGVLLHGPSGCGKSSIIRQLCAQYGLYLYPVTSTDLSSSEPGGSESKLRSIFQELKSADEATILFLDEIDAICPKSSSHSHVNRLISCLVGLLDELNSNLVVVVAATSHLDDVDPSLRRPGRLDREIHMGVPNGKERLEILEILCKNLNLNSNCLDKIAEMTTGYVGADLDLLVREVAYVRGDDLKDWKLALSKMRPSVMRQGLGNGEFRRVTWDQVGGLEEAKTCIRRSVEWPLKYPEAFERLKVPKPRGVLIYGPPGCGKSLLVRAAATSCSASFFSISAAELFSPYVGDSEKMVTSLFQRARLAVPAILFLDELDAMVGRRSSNTNNSGGRTAQLGVVAALLQEMDGIATSQGVIVVGATNRPDKIDAALMRPGRFDSLVYIPNPDIKTRLSILETICEKMPLTNVNLNYISEKTELYSGADLESLAKEAALSALEEDLEAKEIHQKHFDSAMSKVSPSLTVQQMTFYKNYSTNSSSSVN